MHIEKCNYDPMCGFSLFDYFTILLKWGGENPSISMWVPIWLVLEESYINHIQTIPPGLRVRYPLYRWHTACRAERRIKHVFVCTKSSIVGSSDTPLTHQLKWQEETKQDTNRQEEECWAPVVRWSVHIPVFLLHPQAPAELYTSELLRVRHLHTLKTLTVTH